MDRGGGLGIREGDWGKGRGTGNRGGGLGIREGDWGHSWLPSNTDRYITRNKGGGLGVFIAPFKHWRHDF